MQSSRIVRLTRLKIARRIWCCLLRIPPLTSPDSRLII
jgi:hypothetical protein